jgi:hypothetical protein
MVTMLQLLKWLRVFVLLRCVPRPWLNRSVYPIIADEIAYPR